MCPRRGRRVWPAEKFIGHFFNGSVLLLYWLWKHWMLNCLEKKAHRKNRLGRKKKRYWRRYVEVGRHDTSSLFYFYIKSCNDWNVTSLNYHTLIWNPEEKDYGASWLSASWIGGRAGCYTKQHHSHGNSWWLWGALQVAFNKTQTGLGHKQQSL